MDNKPNNITEGMFSTIDQIRQDSKDVRDFVKNVFADREFKKMSKDKEFIKYLKSIYEGTLLDEEAVAVSTRSADGTITTRIKEDIINEVKYYITRNQGRGRGKSLVHGYDLKKDKKLPPKEFRTFKDAEKEVKRLQNMAKGIPGGGSAYFVTDKKMNPLKESINEILVIVDKFDKRKQDYGKVYYQDGGKRPGDGDINKAKKELAKLSKKHKGLTLISVGRNSKMYDVMDESVNEASIKGRNNKTGETFGMVIGSDKKNREGEFEVTIRIAYSSRISSYKFMFDKGSNLIAIKDYGYSMDGKFPDMKGGGSVKSIRPNGRETIIQIAKITSPAFAKKIVQHVKKVNESVNEAKVETERYFGKKGIIIMIRDGNNMISAIFKDKKNADKFNRNNPSDVKKLVQLAKKTKFPKAIDESLHEGKKRYNVMYGVGSSKYTVNFHNGKSKHNDGSDFFDIAIFKNKRDLAKKINDLTKQGYIYSYQEGLNEASREAMGIAGFTGTRGSAVQKFIDDYNLNARKLFNFVKKGKLKDRMDFVTAIAGKRGNKFQGKMVGMFGEGNEDGVPQGYNPMVESKTKESKVVQMIYKYEKNEKKFYDKMAEHERRIGTRDYAKFIIMALKGFGINPREFKRVPDAEEKLYQIVSKK